jgi:hypothetical protein
MRLDGRRRRQAPDPRPRRDAGRAPRVTGNVGAYSPLSTPNGPTAGSSGRPRRRSTAIPGRGRVGHFHQLRPQGSSIRDPPPYHDHPPQRLLRNSPDTTVENQVRTVTPRWRKQDSSLYGGFSCQAVVWVVLTVFCSERERPFFVPSPAIRFAERAEGVKGPNGSTAWRLAALAALVFRSALTPEHAER